MRLEKLVLSGFKSFADKTTFDFRKNFTAIVGPNGSGKSNISDAIRWVLGEQSLKLLRGKYSQDVIFGGSEKLSKLGMASAELYLTNNNGRFPLDYNEITISRKVFRNGESEYRVNKAKVRLQDIIMMLAQAKFGQRSYSVIGQGMITHFLNASPQERKEFFDEATGVKEFQIKRDKAINKLIRTEEHLGQAEILLNEIEPRLRSLTRQVKRRERREKIELEWQQLQVAYYGSRWHQLATEQSTLRDEQKEKQRIIAATEKDLEQKQKQQDKFVQESSRSGRYHQLQQEYNDILEQKSRLLKDQAVLKGKLELAHEQQGQLNIAWMQRKKDELEHDLHQSQATYTVLHDDRRLKQQELQRAAQKLESLQQELRQEEQNIAQLRHQVEQEALPLSVVEIKSALATLFNKQEQFLRKLLQTSSLAEFKEVQKEAKTITNDFAAFLDTLSAEEKEMVEHARVALHQKEQLIEQLIKDRDAQQKKVNDLMVSLEAFKSRAEMQNTQIQKVIKELHGLTDELDRINQNTAAGDEPQQQQQKYQDALQAYAKEIDQLNSKLSQIQTNIDTFHQEEEQKKARLVELQSQMRTCQRQLNKFQQEITSVEIRLAKIETQQEDLRAEISREVAVGLHVQIYKYVTTDNTVSWEALRQQMDRLNQQLQAIGTVDAETVQEYNATKERHDFLKTQTTDLAKSIQQLERVIDELDKTIHGQFQKNFKLINDGFQKYFKVLFGGGQARLALMTEVESAEESAAKEAVGNAAAGAVTGSADGEVATELSDESLHAEKERELLGKRKKKQKIIAGIEVMASPPGKKIVNVSVLSGGEKALVAISLLCAIIANNPAPFVALDEVEAALDEENSEKFSAILKTLATKTQIIVITHNRVTMRAADVLFGVTMGPDGKSHILSVELKEAEELVQTP